MSDNEKRSGRITFEKISVRFFTALFLNCVLFLILYRPLSFADRSFFGQVRILPFLGAFAGFYAALTVLFTLIDSLRTERLILLLSYTVYALFTSFQTDNIWFGFGACLILLVICVYVFKDCEAPLTRFGIPLWALFAAAAAAGLYLALFTGIQTVCRYLTQSTPNYDFGIFSQMFYYMKNTLQPLVTSERDVLMSHFAVHFSPIFYLFLPFYAIFPSPATLMVCQALLLASGVVPVVMICKKIGLSNKSSALFAVLYALYPAVAGGCFYDLHENKFLLPLLLWLFFFIIKNKWYGIGVFSLLVMLVKEDAAVYTAFTGVYVLFSAVKKDKLKGLAMLCSSAVYFITVTFLLNRYGEGTMDTRFVNFMSDQTDGLINVVANVIKDPAYVVHQMFDQTNTGIFENRIEFLLRMMLPVGALPLITKKLHRYILILPLVLINLMPDYVYQHSIFFQYTYGPFAFLLFAAILNYADMSGRIRRTVGVFAVAASMTVCAQSVWCRNDYFASYINERRYYDSVRIMIESIPEEASVSSDTFYCATASRRRVLYDISETDHITETDYVILDLRTESGREKSDVFEYDPGYERYYGIDGRIAIYRKK